MSLKQKVTKKPTEQKLAESIINNHEICKQQQVEAENKDLHQKLNYKECDNVPPQVNQAASSFTTLVPPALTPSLPAPSNYYASPSSKQQKKTIIQTSFENEDDSTTEFPTN